MFILDTNVLSELRKAPSGRADPRVVRWAGGQAVASLFVSAVTVQELETGVLLIERRDSHQGAVLRRWFEEQVLTAFDARVLPVDTAVARRCAALHVPDPRPVRDSLIAATALVHGMAVATRNVEDFAGTGVDVIDPWAGGPTGR